MVNMPQPESWTEANQRVMAAELARLRRRLVRNGAGHPEAEEVGLARTAMAEPPAINELVAMFDLTAFERDLLLLAAGVEMDAAIASACSEAAAPMASGLNFGLALAALERPHWSALSPSRPLRRWRLIELDERAGLASSRIRIDERVLHYLAGINQLDARLAPLLRYQELPGLMSETQRRAGDRLLQELGEREDAAGCIVLSGDDPEGQADVAAYVADALGRELLTLSLADVPSSASEQEALATLWQREAALLPAALLIEMGDRDHDGALLARFVRRLRCPTFIAAREAAAVPYTFAARVDKPPASEQRALWMQALSQAFGDASSEARNAVSAVSSQFRMSARAIARHAGVESGASESLNTGSRGNDRNRERVREKVDELWQRCCELARPRLEELAQRIEPAARWADIVLPEPQLQTLRQIAAQVRQRIKVYTDWGFSDQGPRGLGITALFFGESGVGKTMACEVLAAELGLDLYRIDLSSVVSKYIGETEKNLRRVFDAAEDSGAILLFDEADALFGKRSEVKDSHDRYANIEVSYLLQRMEAYRGLAVLTTNQRSALDPAFLRRLRFVVQFPFPDQAQREEIWRRVFPTAMPREALDYGKLSRLQMPGGNIRNIALNAAFLAAEADEPVRMVHLARAAHHEAAKHERALSEAHTREWR
jgi:hypothetical protein